jgi:hypothetical protein
MQKQTTNDVARRLLPPPPREQHNEAGHLLKACICTIKNSNDFHDYQFRSAWDNSSPWDVTEGCGCHGTHFVCAYCGNQRWVILNSKVIPCDSCCEVVGSRVDWQPWMVSYVNRNGTIQTATPAIDSKAEERERKVREWKRRERVAALRDDFVSQEIYDDVP